MFDSQRRLRINTPMRNLACRIATVIDQRALDIAVMLWCILHIALQREEIVAECIDRIIAEYHRIVRESSR